MTKTSDGPPPYDTVVAMPPPYHMVHSLQQYNILPLYAPGVPPPSGIFGNVASSDPLAMPSTSGTAAVDFSAYGSNAFQYCSTSSMISPYDNIDPPSYFACAQNSPYYPSTSMLSQNSVPSAISIPDNSPDTVSASAVYPYREEEKTENVANSEEKGLVENASTIVTNSEASLPLSSSPLLEKEEDPNLPITEICPPYRSHDSQ